MFRPGLRPESRPGQAQIQIGRAEPGPKDGRLETALARSEVAKVKAKPSSHGFQQYVTSECRVREDQEVSPAIERRARVPKEMQTRGEGRRRVDRRGVIRLGCPRVNTREMPKRSRGEQVTDVVDKRERENERAAAD